MNNLKFRLASLDTNIFVYHFEGNTEFGQKAKQIFIDLLNNKIRAVTSIITLSELLSSPKLDKIAVKETRKLLLEVPNLEIYQVDEVIALKSAEIRRKYGFQLFDSIQLATALKAKAQVFITNDDKLKTFKEIKILTLKDLSS